MLMNYIYVLLSAALLAVEFALNKKYQALEGVSTIAGLRFNALSGFLSALIVWIFSGFRLEWSAFSLGLALSMALCCITYSMIGFRILKQGGLALYSTFLMSGGMLLPYIFGIVFLNEMLTLLRVLGILLCHFASPFCPRGRFLQHYSIVYHEKRELSSFCIQKGCCKNSILNQYLSVICIRIGWQ